MEAIVKARLTTLKPAIIADQGMPLLTKSRDLACENVRKYGL